MQADSDRMVDLRLSDNKIDHTSGPKPFAIRAQEEMALGEKAPILKVAHKFYKQNAPEKAVSFIYNSSSF